MSWSSIHPNHAIERMRFEITFTEALPKKLIDSIGIAFDKMRGELRFGARTERRVITMEFNTNLNAVPSQVEQTGWQAVREPQPGQVAEFFALDSRQLIYETSDYRSWATARKRYSKIVDPIQVRALEAVGIKILAHDYFDRFIFNGSVECAPPQQLLDENIIAALPEPAQNGKSLFHINRGWFVEDLGKKVLLSQNIESQLGTTVAGVNFRSVSIQTRSELRREENNLDDNEIAGSIGFLHSVCNASFAACLAPETRVKVNIKEDGGGIA